MLQHAKDGRKFGVFEPAMVFQECRDVAPGIAPDEPVAPENEFAARKHDRPIVTHEAFLAKQPAHLKDGGEVRHHHIDFEGLQPAMSASEEGPQHLAAVAPDNSVVPPLETVRYEIARMWRVASSAAPLIQLVRIDRLRIRGRAADQQERERKG